MKRRAFNFAVLLLAGALSGAGHAAFASASAESRAEFGKGPSGRATYEDAWAAIAAHAFRHGVRVESLRPQALRTTGTPGADITELYLGYARAVGFGQLEPRAARVPWGFPGRAFEPRPPTAELERLGLEGALASLPPSHPGYVRLVDALARYRGIAVRGGWPGIPGGPVLGAGSRDPRVMLLRRRLAVDGDLADAEGGQEMDDALIRAVVRFQLRHGLEPDGRVGPRTIAALNVPVEERVAQIIANLERWRWMPHRLPLPRAEVNIPAAELTVVETGGEALRMRTVVGSRGHPTPLLGSHIRSVVLNPPWNVPASIWRNEILPRLRREPGYLEANQMRIVGRPEDPYGRRVDWRRSAEIPRGIRIQQQPGPMNALGRVKFDIPNRFDVYLHDTPGRSAFARPERALSHGCVRLENPAALLGYLFRAAEVPPELPSGDGEEAPRTRVVPVPAPLPVLLVYWTAFVHADGTVHFRSDLYGHDARIKELLEGRREALPGDLLAGGCGPAPPA